MFENIANSLIIWFLKYKRDLPWRNTKDPYKIWLSEIILQQTRVAQGLPYYDKFVEQYPTIIHLANASDDEVMKLWQGLGYYSRARNLLFTARLVRDEFNGEFPKSFDEIKKLKGIGDYTAAAIASFAYNLKHPVLDGNVYRFITRLFGIETPIDEAITKTTVMSILTEVMLIVNDPATFNQAIMEFGALQCTPKNPDCANCPFNNWCYALKENKVSQLPLKGKSIKIKDRYFHYFVFHTDSNHTYIKKRTSKDIWENLYEFPLIETLKPESTKKMMSHKLFKEWTLNVDIKDHFTTKPVLHKLTHQNLYVTFYKIKISKFLELKNSPIFEIEKNALNSFAVPKVIANYLDGIIN